MTVAEEIWGLYQWFEEHGTDLIHPEDLPGFRALIPNGKIFECVGRDEEYLTLRYGDMEFRVRPSLFKIVARPSRRFGEEVHLSNGKRGIVTDIQWHFQRAEAMYHLMFDGKKRSRRYWESDFAKEGIE